MTATTVTLNGKPYQTITVNSHALYELINQHEVKDGLLTITAQAPGLGAYAFTFGN